jgi:hypothetical protein
MESICILNSTLQFMHVHGPSNLSTSMGTIILNLYMCMLSGLYVISQMHLFVLHYWSAEMKSHTVSIHANVSKARSKTPLL